MNKNGSFLKQNKVLLLISFFALIGIFVFLKNNVSSSLQENNKDKIRADLLADAYQELDDQNDYKIIKIGKPSLLYDGTKFTVYNIQIYEPAQIVRYQSGDNSKYIAIALDVEIDRQIDKVRIYFEESKSIYVYTDKKNIDNYFSETIVDPNFRATNSHSMKWAMEELEHELMLFITDKTGTRLDGNYIRLAFNKESSQPNIFTLWREYKSKDMTYVDAPRKLRGWVTWIFKVDEGFIDDKVDYSFGESLYLKYKNTGGNLDDLLEELGKKPK